MCFKENMSMKMCTFTGYVKGFQDAITDGNGDGVDNDADADADVDTDDGDK